MTAKNQSSVSWQSPSNIALVKYWGKKGFQLPSNASISFTLDECHSKTTLLWTHNASGESDIKVLFDGIENVSFLPKIQALFSRISEEHPIVQNFDWEIRTSNTFPHSSGIASSASGMSALALCVTDALMAKGVEVGDFFQFASNLARLGSGSASRSVYGKIAQWGSHSSFPGSSDKYAIPITNSHPVFDTFHDTILLVHEGVKSVSSSVGHKTLVNHAFSKGRFEIARKNMERIRPILQRGDLDEFVKLVEAEAMMLHGLMMTSSPPYILMKPGTLAIIQIIRQSRKEIGHHICFTLDAGANVHMLYPEKDSAIADKLIQDQLVVYCENGRYIRDIIGQGPRRIDA